MLPDFWTPMTAKAGRVFGNHYRSVIVGLASSTVRAGVGVGAATRLRG